MTRSLRFLCRREGYASQHLDLLFVTRSSAYVAYCRSWSTAQRPACLKTASKRATTGVMTVGLGPRCRTWLRGVEVFKSRLRIHSRALAGRASQQRK